MSMQIDPIVRWPGRVYLQTYIAVETYLKRLIRARQYEGKHRPGTYRRSEALVHVG